MPVTFDGTTKIITATAGTTSLSVSRDIYSAWKVWVATGNNSKYLPAFRTVGGDPTVGGNTIAAYFFLLNGWKLKPQEANHTLTISGILLVDGGGDPFLSTNGVYNVRIVATVPLQAEEPRPRRDQSLRPVCSSVREANARRRPRLVSGDLARTQWA